MKDKTIKALDVAKNIINISCECGDGISNLKLQKLLYYTQAWHIVLFGKKLFEEDFQAWVHGPVIPSVYGYFKEFSYSPIEEQKKAAKLPVKVVSHIKEVLTVFGGFSAYQLELMTHDETPWKNARKGLAPDEASKNLISTEDMKTFYSSMKNG